MISLEELTRNILIPTFPADAKVKIGKRDQTNEKIIVVKEHDRQEVHNTCGKSRSVYDMKHIRLTVRWTVDYSQTEYAANQIYKKIEKIKNQVSDNFKVLFITMDDEQSKPNRKQDDILERFIDFVVYYQE